MSLKEPSSFRSQVEFVSSLPTLKKISSLLGFEPEQVVVIYDKKLRDHGETKSWLKRFPLSYPVSAGEKLKDLDYFPSHVRKVMKTLGASAPRNLCFVALGGGTVGDFVGFLASIYKRGVPLIQIPTTFLSALDSAHGGKTALNVGSVKNQVGSFYPSQAVVIVRSLLESLPRKQLQSASGELIKMAFLKGGEFYHQVHNSQADDFAWLWEAMPQAVEAKYEIVDMDPLERTGQRQWLNLGHSLGHALEAHYALAHGTAVAYGLRFALEWSVHRGYLKAGEAEELLRLLQRRSHILSVEDFFSKHRKMSKRQMAKYISQDKKLTDSAHLNFIFLTELGKPLGKKVTLDSFLTEASRQGWL